MSSQFTSDTDTLPPIHDIQPGTRVEVLGTPIGVTFRSPLGHIVRTDRWEGSYIVRMDEPAIYHNEDGTTEELPEIREDWDNLLVLTIHS